MSEYRDLHELGRGGFATVFLCERVPDNARFARKTLNASASARTIDRFRQEVRILATLDHPNIIRVLDSQLTCPPYWYVMPWCRTSLRDELNQVIGNPQRVQKIFSAILDGVEYAHREGVIHRDLNPRNVLMNNDDDVVVTDFGIGRVLDAEGDRFTRTGVTMGTDLYRSPEQVTDAKRVDHRTDIFSLGRMLYELYTERLSTAVQDCTRLPPALAGLVERCTLYSPDQRYADVSDLKDAWRIALSDPGTDTDLAEARRLITEIVATPRALPKVRQLFVVLARNQRDDDLLRDALMQVPPESISLVMRDQKDLVRQAVKQFVGHVLSQTWGATYLDKIGSRCGNLFLALKDEAVRANLLSCVLRIGVTFKRYAVLEILAHLIQAIDGEAERQAIMARLREVPKKVRAEAGQWLEMDSIDPSLAELFRP
jgi:serine/threonine protein kinase